MCAFNFSPPLVLEGLTVKRTIIRYRRLHRYCVDRFLVAQTPAGARFWRGMMDRCTAVIDVFEPLPARTRSER